MGHKEAKTAEKKQTKKVEEVQRTDEQILKDIRLNLDAHLSVTPKDINFLLRKYYLAICELGEFKYKLGEALMTIDRMNTAKPDSPPEPPPNVPFMKGA